MNPEYFGQEHYDWQMPVQLSDEELAALADIYARDPIFKQLPAKGRWLKTSNGGAVFVPEEAEFRVDEYIIKETV